MTATQASAQAAQPATTFESRNPATDEVIATFPVHAETDVSKAVERARGAATWWRDLGHDGRKRRMRAWRTLLVRRSDEFAELIHRENGKPVDDALGEIILAIEHVSWAASNAEKVLGRRRVAPGMLAMNHTASAEYVPFGVVGVIGPWNYPVHTPMGSITYALAAGNAVVFKPSEYTPAIGKWLVDAFAEVVPEQPVFGLVTGFGATGAALCRAGVDKLAFTGSTATGKKVMAACAETLTPILIECGGKDALIVADDADLDAAVDATVWGAMANSGQTCTGVERAYVVEPLYDEFVARVTREAGRIRGGSDAAADYGPMTMPAQIDVIRRHIDDALARPRRRRGGAARQREPVRARRRRVQREAWRADRCPPVVRHGQHQLGDHVCDRAGPAVRRCAQLRLRTDPRAGRAARVRLAARRHAPALPVADQGAHIPAHPARCRLAGAYGQGALGSLTGGQPDDS